MCDHYSRDCKSSFRCRPCNKKQHSSILPRLSASGSSSAIGLSNPLHHKWDVSTTTVAPVESLVEVPKQVIQSSAATIYAASLNSISSRIPINGSRVGEGLQHGESSSR